jgi:Flp pilus assembly pilin Flp
LKRRKRVKNWLSRLWNDESGAETAEWVVVVALIVGVAVVIYLEVLEPQLNTAVSTIGSTIVSAASG